MASVDFTYTCYKGRTTTLYFLEANGKAHLFDGRSIPNIMTVSSSMAGSSGRGKSQTSFTDYWLDVREGVKLVRFLDPIPKKITTWNMLSEMLKVSVEEAKSIMLVHNKKLFDTLR